MWGRSIPVLLGALAVAGCASAAAEIGWDAADDNDDDLVSRAEFATFMDDMDGFNAYDDNGDGALDSTEYREAVAAVIEGDAYFRGFDRDHSGGLSQQEFVDGVFTAYDRDNDGWLDESQFSSAVDGLAFEL